jgi:hypothetical protein
MRGCTFYSVTLWTARRKRYKRDKVTEQSAPPRRSVQRGGKAQIFLLGLSLAGFDPDSDIRFTGFGWTICGFD